MHKTRWIIIAAILPFLITACGKNTEPDQSAISVYTFSPPPSYPPFSGARAWDLAKAQVDIGPRTPNSAAHDSALAMFREILGSTGAIVREQRFSLKGYDNETLKLTNVLAQFNPSANIRVVLAAHWDCRPRADMETDPAKQHLPIPGANDGASGVGILLHLAEIFASAPPPIGVDLLFLDGEDYGKEGDANNYCLGAQYFASTISPEYNPQFGILLDLVGDTDARFLQEGYSVQFAPDIVRLIWDNAKTLNLPEFIPLRTDPILDDHVSMNTTAGIKMIDIIDGELIGHKSANTRKHYWHTMHDTMENLSPETLGHVGTLLVYTMYGLRESKRS